MLGTILGFDVWVVDGNYVRTVIDIDFVEGGNGGCYTYIPISEVWVEKAEDQLVVVLHEIIECTLMVTNGLDYDSAHNIADEQELKVRKILNEQSISFENLYSLLEKVVPTILKKNKLKN